MWSSFKAFCEEHGLAAHEEELHVEQLAAWKHVFENYISKDIFITETDPLTSLHKYYQLTKDYIENFLLHVPDDLMETLPIWNGDNAVHYAAKKGYHHFIKHAYQEYLQAHPDDVQNKIDAQNRFGMRALHLAAGAGHVQTTAVLLDLGANPSLRNKNAALPIYFAATLPMRYSIELKIRKEEILNLLLDKAPLTLNYKDRKNETIVHLLAAFGYTSLLEKLIAQDKTLLSTVDSMQHRPIHHAILNNRYETVALLLSSLGDDASYLVGFAGQWPIHYAALRGTEAMVKLCCEKRPQDIKKTDDSGHTALSIAEVEHNFEAQKVLSTYYNADDIRPVGSKQHLNK